MIIKHSIQSYLIYATMGLYFLAFVLLLINNFKQNKTGALKLTAFIFYGLGFALAVISFGYRWIAVEHIPMKNLYEVFITLAMLLPVITLISKKMLDINYETVDAFWAFILLVPPGFVASPTFSEYSAPLMPALQTWLFAPHIGTYMLGYVIMFKAAGPACRGLFQGMGLLLADKDNSLLKKILLMTILIAIFGMLLLLLFLPSFRRLLTNKDNCQKTQRDLHCLISFGFPLLTAGLLLGACWGQLAWGSYWQWDPKELWSLAAWLMFLLYFHCRYAWGYRFYRLNCALALTGVLLVFITLLWVNLSKLFGGLHSYA